MPTEFELTLGKLLPFWVRNKSNEELCDYQCLQNIIRVIQIFRTVHMSVIRNDPIDSMCEKDHHDYRTILPSICGMDHHKLLSFNRNSSSSPCTLQGINCVMNLISYAHDRVKEELKYFLDNYLPDSNKDYQWLDKYYEDLEQVQSRVIEISLVLEKEIFKSFMAACQVQLVWLLIRCLWNLLMGCTFFCQAREELDSVEQEKLIVMALLVSLVDVYGLEQTKLVEIFSCDVLDKLRHCVFLYLVTEMDHGILNVPYSKIVDILNFTTEERNCLHNYVDQLLDDLTLHDIIKERMSVVNGAREILIQFSESNITVQHVDKDAFIEHYQGMRDSQICALSYSITSSRSANLLYVSLSNALETFGSGHMQFEVIHSNVLTAPSLLDGTLWIDHIFSNISKLLLNSTSLGKVKPLLDIIQPATVFISSFLKIIRNQNVNEDIANENCYWVTECTTIAYELVDIVDTLVVNGPSWDCMKLIFSVLGRCQDVRCHITALHKPIILDVQNHTSATPNKESHGQIYSRFPNMPPLSDLMGFGAEFVTLKDLLTRDLLEKQDDVIAIIGMAGIGKTTLARKLYSDEGIQDKFDVCLWCRISQEYNEDQVLDNLLSQLSGPNNKGGNIDILDRAHEILRQKLLGSRYLIVIDDIWSTSVWDGIIRSFPVQKNGSRILLTTRDRIVADHAKRHTEHCHLLLRSEEQSWLMLKKLVLQTESCPPALEEVGKQIAAQCQGLPLTIALIAGLLANVERNRHCWVTFRDNLELTTKDVYDSCLSTIELSYDQLPDHLKACFLYVAAFEEGKDISVKNLLRMWTAERFVSSSDKAKLCLSTLISRNLLISHKYGSIKNLKSIHIHDLIRKFCLVKSRMENFLVWLHKSADQNSAQSNRVCAHYKPHLMPKIGNLHCTSILYGGIYSTKYIHVLNLAQHIKLATVLHLDSLMRCEDIKPILMLVQLRYLFVRLYTAEITTRLSVISLPKLETLVLTSSVILPGIWDIVKLQHLHVGYMMRSDELFHNCSRLVNLESWSCPLLSWDNAGSMNMPNLQNLKCLFEDSESYCSGSQVRDNFPNLEALDKLECLSIEYVGSRFLPCQLNLPSSLRKLTLCRFSLCIFEQSMLKFSKLEALKLKDFSIQGGRWATESGIFPSLRYLKLAKMPIRQWIACSQAFPILEHLVLERCEHLECIPSDFANIATLQTIEVRACCRAIGDSAQQIRRDLEDSGVDGCEVCISDVLEDQRRSSYPILSRFMRNDEW